MSAKSASIWLSYSDLTVLTLHETVGASVTSPVVVVVDSVVVDLVVVDFVVVASVVVDFVVVD